MVLVLMPNRQVPLMIVPCMIDDRLAPGWYPSGSPLDCLAPSQTAPTQIAFIIFIYQYEPNTEIKYSSRQHIFVG
jgi:hypothetical protein